MDPRIMKHVNAIHEAEAEQLRIEKQKEKEAELRAQEYIKSKVPEAEVWVDEVLIPKIAELMSKKNPQTYDKMLYLDPYAHNEINSGNIPVESKVIAIKNKNIEGVYLEKNYDPESSHPNDETGCCIIPAHYSYIITWK